MTDSVEPCPHSDVVYLGVGVDYCADCDSIRHTVMPFKAGDPHPHPCPPGPWRPRHHYDGDTTIAGEVVTREELFQMSVAHARDKAVVLEAERLKLGSGRDR